MHHKITTLIFDMYGVILKERTGNFIPYTFEHFEKAEHERIKDLIENQKLFTKAGLGELSSAEFLSLLGYKDVEYHMKNYIENYLSFDTSFIAFAEKHHRNYDFVLLSTDISEWSKYITQHYELDNYFKHKIVSGDVHCRKPDKRIYEIALTVAQRKPDECLFIDDNLANILSAKSLGIESVLFNRFQEQYEGCQVNSFEELDKVLQSF